MPDPNHSPSSSLTPVDARPSRGAWALLITAVIVAVALKLITADRPIARDVMLYTVIGHEMFEGRELYSDLFEHKPPAFLFVYGVANRIAGYGPPAVLLLNLTFTLTILAGVYRAARNMGGSVAVGGFAALCWALVSNDVNMHAHQPMPEGFINACLIWAFALFLELDKPALQVGRCLAIGTALMLASQVKQPTVIVAAAFAVVHLFTRVSAPGEHKRRFAQIAIIAGVGIVTWVGLFAYFAATDRLKIFYDSLFTYNKFYAGVEDPDAGFVYGLKVMWWNFSNGLIPSRLFPAFLLLILPLLLASFAALPAGIRSNARRSWLLWLAYFLSVFFLVTSPGRGYPHYYQVYLPVLAVGAAGALTVLERRLHASTAARTNWGVALVCTLALIIGTVHQLTSSSTPWERPGYAFHYTKVKRLAAELDQVLQPEETLYVWDYQPAFYVLTDRSPPAGIFYNAHAMKGPLVEELSGRVLRMFTSNPPEVLITRDQGQTPKDAQQTPHPVDEWIQANAKLVEWPEAAPFLIYVRKGGPLDKRIESGQVKWKYGPTGGPARSLRPDR